MEIAIANRNDPGSVGSEFKTTTWIANSKFISRSRSKNSSRRGVPLRDARLAARRAFGSVALAKEELRDMRTGATLDRCAREMRQAARRLARAPIFTLATVLTLALAIGANVAMFAVVYRVVVNPLPYGDSDRLVALENGMPSRNIAFFNSHTTQLYYQYLDRARTLEGLAHSSDRRPDADRRWEPGAHASDAHDAVARLGAARGAGARAMVHRRRRRTRRATGGRVVARPVDAAVRPGPERPRSARDARRCADHRRRRDGVVVRVSRSWRRRLDAVALDAGGGVRCVLLRRRRSSA